MKLYRWFSHNLNYNTAWESKIVVGIYLIGLMTIITGITTLAIYGTGKFFQYVGGS